MMKYFSKKIVFSIDTSWMGGIYCNDYVIMSCILASCGIVKCWQERVT